MTMQLVRTQDGGETWDSSGSVTEYELKYLVVNPTSKREAMDAVFADAPSSKGALTLSGVRFESYDEDGTAEISALYDASGGEDSGSEDDADPVVSFDCSGGQKHLTHAISQRRAHPSGDDDTGGAIGWNGKTGPEMEITGVDIPTGQLRETYSKTMKLSDITTARKRAWSSLVGKVNSASFNGWKAGEVMFLGASFSGSNKKDAKVTVTFTFSIQENEDAAEVNGIACGPKAGFECMWAISDTSVGEDHNPEAKVKGIYIATVCRSGNFGVLGL